MAAIVCFGFLDIISHLLITSGLLSEGYIAIVHDAAPPQQDTIPWLVEETNTLNCKLNRVVNNRFLLSRYRVLLIKSLFFCLDFCQGFACFGMVMETILGAARRIHARLITVKMFWIGTEGKHRRWASHSSNFQPRSHKLCLLILSSLTPSTQL